MSPLWRDEVTVYLAPGRIALTRHSRGFGARVAEHIERAVPGEASLEGTAALAVLEEQLRLPVWRDATARVIVANPWTRFAIVPATGARLNAQGRQAHARYLLTEFYGGGLDGWQVTVEDVPPDRSACVCALPEWVRPSLAPLFADAKLRLRSMQPYLVVAYNAWRRHLPTEEAWFVTLQDGWLAAAHLQQGRWDEVRSLRLAAQADRELERLQALGRMTREASGTPRMLVEVPAWSSESLSALRDSPRLAGLPIEWLEIPLSPGARGQSPGSLRQAEA